MVPPAVGVARALDQPLVSAMTDTIQRTQAALECLNSHRQQVRGSASVASVTDIVTEGRYK
eukprot:1195752-Prorocentrum_minimum.AAC.2